MTPWGFRSLSDPFEHIGPERFTALCATRVMSRYRSASSAAARLFWHLPTPGASVAWRSTDGRTWTKSEPIGGKANGPDPEATWWTPDGWELAAVDFFRDGDWAIELFASSDGLAWQQAAEITGRGRPISVAASRNGTLSWPRTASGGSPSTRGEDGPDVLLSSTDGVTWNRLDVPFGRRTDFSGVVAPDGRLGSWLVITHDSRGQPTAWTSTNLQGWQAHDVLGASDVSVLVATSRGYIVSSADPACVIACDPIPHLQFVSLDGAAWAQIEPALEARPLIADGPAGVIAVEPSTGDDGATVWLLASD